MRGARVARAKRLRVPSPSQRYALGPSLSHFVGEGQARAESESPSPALEREREGPAATQREGEGLTCRPCRFRLEMS